MTPTDLRPAAQRMADLVAGVADDQLGAPTPCAGTALGSLIDHISEFSRAFTAAAAKDVDDDSPASQPPSPDAANLGEDWRTRIPIELTQLADAWAQDDAWTGMTKAGGIDLPGEAAGLIALDELVVHGWDIAMASGQRYRPDEGDLAPVFGFLQDFVGDGGAPREGLFGPPVDVADDAPLLDRILGITGRDPAWRSGR